MHGIKALLFDWGNTLMPELPGMKGPMADWPEVAVMPGVARLLPRFAESYVCAIATGASDSTEEQVAHALARAGIGKFVSHIFLAKEMGFMKFQPEYYAEIARRLNLLPSEILMIGDDYQNDIMPAKSVGMKTALIQTAPGRYPNADIVVPEFGQLALFVET